jgi:hypothetical protein
MKHSKTLRPLLTAVIWIGASCLAALYAAFPDAHDPPPAGWKGHVFKLSQNYPATLPALEAASKRKWTTLDFKNPVQAPQYLKAVLDYCLEGNTANNFNDVSANTVRTWYHAPWLHSTDSGREFIYGMTRERRSKMGELGPAQTNEHDNWAFGFYNDRGGFTIGQVWKDPAHPDPRKGVFPVGTVTCKLLFTTTPQIEAPFLDGTFELEADINRAKGTGTRPKVRLLQIDVAVRDSRADSTTGWVFGTFQYEKAASTSANWWDHMVPIGLMWGNDVAKLKADLPTTQEWINTTRGQKLHLGRKDLILNGPVDHPDSSCIACHAQAQIPKTSGAAPLPNRPPLSAKGKALDPYFKNLKAAEPFSSQYVSVDYSLQLQVGISRALKAKAVTLPPGISAIKGKVSAAASSAVTEFPEVTR